jgi:hypothetical protein
MAVRAFRSARPGAVWWRPNTLLLVSLSVSPELTSLVHTLVILFTEYGNYSGDRKRRAGVASLLGVGSLFLGSICQYGCPTSRDLVSSTVNHRHKHVIR